MTNGNVFGLYNIMAPTEGDCLVNAPVRRITGLVLVKIHLLGH